MMRRSRVEIEDTNSVHVERCYDLTIDLLLATHIAQSPAEPAARWYRACICTIALHKWTARIGEAVCTAFGIEAIGIGFEQANWKSFWHTAHPRHWKGA